MTYKLENVKILIVDDMTPLLSLTSSVLKTFGFKHIFTATNGEDAYRILCKEDPDLVLTDWMMPGMDGLELAEKIRRDPMSPNPYVPILMMTGFSSRLRVEGARDKGITEFLVKPFASRDLYRRITQVAEKPRQFVEAGTFFGPDRRRKSDDNYDGLKKREKDQGDDTSDENAHILKRLREEAKNVSN